MALANNKPDYNYDPATKICTIGDGVFTSETDTTGTGKIEIYKTLP